MNFDQSIGYGKMHIETTLPIQLNVTPVLMTACLETPLGPMKAIADEKNLYLLEFMDHPRLERTVEHLRQRLSSTVISGFTQAIHLIEKELKQYFEGRLREFKTSLCFLGSSFQQMVWKELAKIPFGETRSYSEIAQALGRPSSFRAVAGANGANPLAIIIPCHRVIHADDSLSGYSGGVSRKKWLLEHEKKKAS